MRYTLFVAILLILLISLSSAGCSGASVRTTTSGDWVTSRTPEVESQAVTRSIAPSPEPTEADLPPDATEVVATGREDLARRLDVDRDAIEVISIEAVEWPDASLGCPRPDEMVAQVATPGFRVVLEVRGERYEYHTDREQTAVLCEEEPVMGPPTVLSPVESGLNSLVHSAQEDLAQRLSIKVEQIEVIEAKSVVWPDASVGCPQPGMRYRQVPQDGALIRLQAEGRVYEYHNGGTRGLFLCEQPAGTPKSTSPQLDLFAVPPDSEDR